MILSTVENSFGEKSNIKDFSAKIPFITVSNIPDLGLFSSLRFLEWVSHNPNGAISLATGKIAVHFTSWTKFFLNNWNSKKAEELRGNYGLNIQNKPIMNELRFVQMNEFYPIASAQTNSLYHYINKHYIKGFGIDESKALLINPDNIPLENKLHYKQVFPDNCIDLSLRHRAAQNVTEEIQQASILKIDNWCTKYEKKIHDLGGIGFFLGGIGPDGHIAFNIKGSDHYSTTRLTATNFETQAASAPDLGGIETARNRKVITIGLKTITTNPECVTIILACGQAYSTVVKQAIEESPDIKYPASALQTQKNARFYLTEGVAMGLNTSVHRYFTTGNWNQSKTEKAVYDLCIKKNKYAHRLTTGDLKNDKYCSLIPGLSSNTIDEVINGTKEKINRGLLTGKNQTFLHTGPHHDDILLGIFPSIVSQLREAGNKFYFSILTSGNKAVTNDILIKLLEQAIFLIEKGQIQMLNYNNFYTEGYLNKWDKDVAHYLNNVAEKNEAGKIRGIAHRLIRAITYIYKIENTENLENKIEQLIIELKNYYEGEPNSKNIGLLKGMLREYEEELLWAHYGVQVKSIKHHRFDLGSYTDTTYNSNKKSHITELLEYFMKIRPTQISFAYDPEGTGPDTHYKVLQLIYEAISIWNKKEDLSNLKLIGYRNVWSNFSPHECNTFIPVSLNSMAVLNQSFNDCYVTQKNASFPSYEFDGPFSAISQKKWVEQFKKVQLILGKDFFYQHSSPKMRATHGMIFCKEMNVKEFLGSVHRMRKSVNGNN